MKENLLYGAVAFAAFGLLAGLSFVMRHWMDDVGHGVVLIVLVSGSYWMGNRAKA